MAPGKDFVHVAHLLVQPIVRCVADWHDGVHAAGRVAEAFGQGGDFFVVRDCLGILHTQIVQRTGDRLVDVNAGDHKWPKKIALAAFVDAKARLELLRLCIKRIGERRLAKHLRLERKLNKLLRALALNQQLAALVPCHGNAGAFVTENRVRHLDCLEVALGQNPTQCLRLFRRQLGGVAGHQAAGSTHLPCSRIRSTRLSTASASGMLKRTGVRPT